MKKLSKKEMKRLKGGQPIAYIFAMCPWSNTCQDILGASSVSSCVAINHPTEGPGCYCDGNPLYHCGDIIDWG
jgi:natural product precursor